VFCLGLATAVVAFTCRAGSTANHSVRNAVQVGVVGGCDSIVSIVGPMGAVIESGYSIRVAYADSIEPGLLRSLENEGWGPREIMSSVGVSEIRASGGQVAIANGHAVVGILGETGRRTCFLDRITDDRRVGIKDIEIGRVIVRDASGAPMGGVPVVLCAEGTPIAASRSRDGTGEAIFYGPAVQSRVELEVRPCRPFRGQFSASAFVDRGELGELIVECGVLSIALRKQSASQLTQDLLVCVAADDLKQIGVGDRTYSLAAGRLVPSCYRWAVHDNATFRGITLKNRGLTAIVLDASGRQLASQRIPENSSGSTHVDMENHTPIACWIFYSKMIATHVSMWLPTVAARRR
jgi:hypothetical protein